MEEDYKNRIAAALRDREKIDDSFIGIESILRINGMDGYSNICRNRCLEYVDGVHVKKYADGKLIIDAIGLEKVRHILQGYLSEKTLYEYKVFLEAEQTIVKSLNASIASAYRQKAHQLRIIARTTQDENIKWLAEQELKYRKPLNVLRAYIKKAYCYISFKVALGLYYCVNGVRYGEERTERAN